MKLLYLLTPLLIACLPQTPKDQDVVDSASTNSVIDPLASEAWHLENRGQMSFSSALALAGEDSKIKQAHELGFTGKHIRIAVSDDGLDRTHPDLKDNELVGEHRNYLLSPPYIGSPVPAGTFDSHGTAVTGLIAAIKGNTLGSYGVAPDAQFAGFQYLNSNQENAMFLHQLQGNFDIFNYSYGAAGCIITPNYSNDYRNALIYGVTQQRNQLGSIYVKAAGNSFQGPLSECATGVGNQKYWGNANLESEQTVPYLIIVGAINARGIKSSYSTPGSNLWVSGLGGEDGVNTPAMITTDLQGCSRGWSHSSYGSSLFEIGQNDNNKNCDYIHTMNGTSSAAPVVAGVVALLLEANPQLTWRDVKHILAKTADKVDYKPSSNTLAHPQSILNLPDHTYDYKWVINQAGNLFSNWYGFGRVNAKNAVEMAKSYTFLGPYIEGSKLTSSAINLTIPSGSGNNSTGVSHSQTYSSSVNKIESVEVEVEIDHHFLGDLGIEITSPSGTTSKLTLINSWTLDWLKGSNPTSNRKLQLLSNAFYEENSNGSWTLKVIDGDTTNTQQGTLKSWSLKINGRAN